MQYYELAGINVGIECEDEYLIKRMKPFQTEPVQDTGMVVHIRLVDRIDEPKGEIMVAKRFKWFRKPDHDEGYVIYMTGESDESTAIMSMDVSADWSRINLNIEKEHYSGHAGQGTEQYEYLYPFSFCSLAFRNMLIHHDGLVIHSSSIAFRNKGIIFTAPSGTGKSTHVKLWEQIFGEEVTVVNDDTPAIRFMNDIPMLSGTPWSGCSDKFANIQIPLKAIVILQQYPENMIRKLSKSEALPMLMSRCFLPYFDEKMMAISCGLIERLLDKVDIYHLRCLPDKEAVELVYKCIM